MQFIIIFLWFDLLLDNGKQRLKSVDNMYKFKEIVENVSGTSALLVWHWHETQYFNFFFPNYNVAKESILFPGWECWTVGWRVCSKSRSRPSVWIWRWLLGQIAETVGRYCQVRRWIIFVFHNYVNPIRDAPIPIPGISIGWIGAKKGVSISVMEHEYWYR